MYDVKDTKPGNILKHRPSPLQGEGMKVRFVNKLSI